MDGFVDETRIHVSSGAGGSGGVSFRREKFIPMGGPDGGDGGVGGAVVFHVKTNVKTLSHVRLKHTFRGQNGGNGHGARKAGRGGEDTIIEIPPGTLVKDAETEEILRDFSEDKEEVWVFLKGGRGGKGNWHFRTSRNQAPRFSQPGEEGQERILRLELQLIADIGLVGFPNAGKSTLLTLFTNARPQIAPYPFTTKIPHLGVINYKDCDIVVADIPGIIEGAHDGAGLGLRFLKHISRTRGLAFCIDLSDEKKLDAFGLLMEELKAFSPGLADKPRLVIGTKTDMDPEGTALEELRKHLPDETVLGLSNFDRSTWDAVSQAFLRLLP